jgi:hypothetical protein
LSKNNWLKSNLPKLSVGNLQQRESQKYTKLQAVTEAIKRLESCSPSQWLINNNIKEASQRALIQGCASAWSYKITTKTWEIWYR